MHPHVFVDESKARRGYLLAAAFILPCNVTGLRKTIGALQLPNQERIHFVDESDTRRKTILSVMEAAAGHVVTIYDASAFRDVKAARDAAMARLVDDAAKAGAERLVIETDDQAVASDKRIIRERVEQAGCQDFLRYDHRRAREDRLLSIPDAVAWSWAKGPPWRLRASGLLTHVVEV
jgi:2-C-methyl-D-erythritol 4-phosphate cytidylyltransferase